MPDRRRTQPRTIPEAIALLQAEIAERETALAVLIDLLARYPAEVEPRPRVGGFVAPAAAVDPPTPGFTYSERGHTVAHDAPAGDDDANVVPLPKRDAG